MNQPSRPSDSSARRNAAAEDADWVCDEFEQAWRADRPLPIEDCLERVPPPQRSLLFRELLEIELHARHQRGDFPEVDGFARRFPEYQDIVASLFEKWGRRRLGDYEILREIGHGGMGVVYQAQHRLLHQVVALKVLPEPSLGDRQAVRRFQREMLSVGRLNHPNIIRALNAGEERGVLYLVTEFIDGRDFRQLVAQHGLLNPPAACELIRQAAVGLQHIHEQGLVHRDIKPANLMLARDATVKILDLGLARMDYRPMTRELTHPGTPMGTLDYMAPEQWVDSRTVDIRADIYGLGCTLFFLLTGLPPNATDPGSPPVGEPAQIAARGPRLGALPSDCPPALDEILDRMLAERPEDRFATPAELAAALASLADLPEAARLASVSRPPEPLGQDDLTPARNTTRTQASPLFSPDASRPSLAQPAGRRGWGLEAILAAATVSLVLVVLLVLQSWAPRLFPPESFPSPPGASAEAAATLAALPGLNGRWWFDETPWLLPSVRAVLTRSLTADARSARQTEPRLGDVAWLLEPNIQEVHRRLSDLVRANLGRLLPPQAALCEALLELSQQDLSDEQLAARLRAELERFDQAVGEPASLPAVDAHTRAVLQHKIAAITNDRTLAEDAARSYQAAVAAYQAEDSGSFALRARCLVDAGQLDARVLQDYPAARRRFREARSLAGAPELLQAEAWLDEGIASAASNPDAAEKYAQAGLALGQAQLILQDHPLGSANHPLLAHLHERYAWILMDQWNVRRASQEFQEARNIRFDNYWKSKNQIAQIFVFHNDHGQAMAERYCGDERLARAQYELVLGEIEKALNRADAAAEGPGWQQFRRDLRERRSNSSERRADCELYGGAASGAPVDLKEAARLYALARDLADDPPVRIAMSCKRAIVLALDGRLDEARQEFGQASVKQQVVIGVHEERVRLLRQLAEATLLAQGSDPAAGLAALRAFLKDFDLDPNYPDRHRRETQELQLLAAELLIAAQWRQGSRESAVADLTFLDRLIAAFPYRDQMLPYLRRYYDLAVEVICSTDSQRAAGYILASRNQRPVAEATLVLFHFGTDRGRVIVRPVDAATACFPLEFGRDEIRQAASGNAGRTLPAEVVELIAAEKQRGREVIVYWSDQPCWAKAADALTRQQWPFGGQLDLDTLREPPAAAN